jgi:hypothetical protein
VPQASAVSEATMITRAGTKWLFMRHSGRKNHASNCSAMGLMPPRAADGSKLAVSVCERMVFVQALNQFATPVVRRKTRPVS